MFCQLVIVRYPRWLGWAGLLSMAVFRIPLAANKKISFWKLLGCGKNGGFDMVPDWRQWGVMVVWSEESGVESEGSGEDNSNPKLQTPNSKPTTPDSSLLTPDFLLSWWRFFGCEVCVFTLQPVEGHGSWDGQQCFGELPRQSGYKEQIAVLTRATIRTGKLRRFWKHAAQAAPAPGIPGYRGSIGIGEMPWIKQATFSIWESSQHLKAWAYQSAAHSDVIRKTRSENWYSEEMFVRFAIRSVAGTIRGENPLERKA